MTLPSSTSAIFLDAEYLGLYFLSSLGNPWTAVKKIAHVKQMHTIIVITNNTEIHLSGFIVHVWPSHGKNCLCHIPKTKNIIQLAHPCSLISAYTV